MKVSGNRIADQIETELQPLRDRIEAQETAHADALRRLDGVRFREPIRGKLVKAGAAPKALSYLLARAAEYFEVVDAEVRAKPPFFSATLPGVPLPIDEWIASAREEVHAFAFRPTKQEST